MLGQKLEIFKEIAIGGVSKDELQQKLIEVGIQFNQYADVLFNHPQFVPQSNREKVKLVKITLFAMGLEESCSFEEFKSRASVLGLKLCPLYLAGFLRLEYLDQQEGPHLTIATEMPERDSSYPNGLYIRNIDGVLWLRGYRADGFVGWPDGNEFIFIQD